MSDKIKPLRTDGFEGLILVGGEIKVVEFGAPWCPPCKALMPVLENLAAENADIKFYTVNVDEEPSLAIRFGIKSMPTVLFFKNGRLMRQIIGRQPKDEYASILSDLK